MNFITSCLLFLGTCYCNTSNYQDAYGILSSIEAKYISKDDYAKYYFYKAVAAHQTLRKDEALASLHLLENNFNKNPKRYELISLAIRNDLENWQSGGLTDVERRMNEVVNLLHNSKHGKEVQFKQKAIINRLDELIKEEENRILLKAEGEATEKRDGDKSNKSNDPLNDSKLMGGEGKGKLDNKKFRLIAEQWGGMTPEKRAAVTRELQAELPAKYKPYIDEYFKSLNRMKP